MVLLLIEFYVKDLEECETEAPVGALDGEGFQFVKLKNKIILNRPAAETRLAVYMR